MRPFADLSKAPSRVKGARRVVLGMNLKPNFWP